MFDVYVIAVLCLVAVSQSAPLACEDLVRPLAQLDPHDLEGRWNLVASGLSDPAHLEKFKSRDSASINFAVVNHTSIISFTRIFGFSSGCQYEHSNITLKGSAFVFEEFNLTVTLLNTSCPDCLVMRFDNISNVLVRLYLFSKRREVEQREMEEFGTLAECLQMLPPVLMDPTKKLCPGLGLGERKQTDKSLKTFS